MKRMRRTNKKIGSTKQKSVTAPKTIKASIKDSLKKNLKKASVKKAEDYLLEDDCVEANQNDPCYGVVADQNDPETYEIVANDLLKLATVINKKKQPLTASQNELVTNQILKAATLLAAKEEEDDKEDPKLQQSIKKIIQRKSEYNKLKNKRIKELIPGVNGQEIVRMKLPELMNLISNI